MDFRTLARLAAVQAIYESEGQGGLAAMLDGDLPARAKEMALVNNFNRINKKVFEQILTNVSRETSLIDGKIRDNLAEDWSFERIGGVLRAILRAAIGESFDGTPKSIIISEYVSIAAGFYDDKEVKFVNAVLDKVI